MLATNEAMWDRTLRIAVAVLMVSLGLSGRVSSPWELALLLFAFYPLITGAMGWDPVYVLLGFRGTRNPPSE